MRNMLWVLIVSLGVASSALVFADQPEPRMDGNTTEAGTLRIVPDTAVSGTFGTWTVTYTVGSGGIVEGGGIRVQLPDEMHAGPRNSANRLQASDPKDDHYVSATCSRPEVALETIVEHEVSNTLVKNAKPSLDGRFERYVFVVRVRLVRGNLQEGDTISVVYGDRSGGSRGYRAGEVSSSPEPVLAAVDADGSNVFTLLAQRVMLRIDPGPPVMMLVHAPSQGVVGKPMRLLVALIDKENNPINEPATLRLSCPAGEADLPEVVKLADGKGYVEVSVEPEKTGTLRITATAEDGKLTATSNPVVVSDKPAPLQIFWGELHSHSHFSWDGVGYNNFEYARYVSGLDFYAMTDHAMKPEAEGTRGLYAGYWDEYTKEVEAHNDPPAFVTLQAYECSFGRPYGHHNVFFRGAPGPLLAPQEVTLPELWKALQAGQALTVPHHTGKFPSGIDFGIHDPEFRRNFEIYSGHGLSESYDPDHPLSFEHSLFTSDSKTLNEPTHAQDVWARGLILSTVAASDDHRAQPGKPYYGLTAVRAAENTRDAVFQALYDRRTYGTTGSKIILDFALNGEPMGRVVRGAYAAALSLSAVGTDAIQSVELLRHDPDGEGFQVINTWTPNALEFNKQYTDQSFQAGCVYYMRLRQVNEVGGRIVMAWSSPIWTR